MNDLLEQSERIISANVISFFVILLIIGFFILSSYLSKKGEASEFVVYTPTLLISLGIFGTFSCVAIGLMDFNPKNLDLSIAILVDALQAGFFTSIMGMLGSLVFSTLLRTVFLQNDMMEHHEGGFSLSEKLLETNLRQLEELREFKKVFLEEENPLLGEITLLRTEIAENVKVSLKQNQEKWSVLEKQYLDAADMIGNKIENFSHTLSSSGTKQMTQALERVIVGFNHNLTEQFGGNFILLNESVKSLVVWQKNHKEQLQQMCLQYSMGVKAMTQTEASLSNICDKSQNISEIMEGLKGVIEVNHLQLSELTLHLESFKDMRDKAINAVPEISRQIEDTVSGISSSVLTVNSHYQKLLSESDHFIQEHAKISEDLLVRFANSTEAGIEKIGTRLESCVERVGSDIATASSIFTQNTERSNEGISKMSKYIESQTEVMFNQLQSVITAFHEQLHEIMGGMSSGASAINVSLVEANADLIKDTKLVRNEVISSIDEMQKHLIDVLENVVSEQHRLSDMTFKSLEKNIVKQVAKTGEVVEKQVSVIDHALQEEINNAFSDMGTQLTKLTGQFTQDYSQLTQQMQDVVNRASNS